MRPSWRSRNHVSRRTLHDHEKPARHESTHLVDVWVVDLGQESDLLTQKHVAHVSRLYSSGSTPATAHWRTLGADMGYSSGRKSSSLYTPPAGVGGQRVAHLERARATVPQSRVYAPS